MNSVITYLLILVMGIIKANTLQKGREQAC